MLEQQLAVGGTYRFTFKPEFVRHGVCPSGVECLHKGGGVFKVQQICTYVEILQANINLYANFFAPLGYSTDEYQKYYNGKPEDQYTPEYTALQVPVEYYDPSTQEKISGISHRLVETGASTRTRRHLEELSYGFNPIYKLIDVVDPDDIVYAPERAILGVPEIGIREYQNMTLAITLGYWDDPSRLDNLLLNIRERLAVHGIRPSNIEAFSSESKWMTPEEYDAITEDRQPGELVELTESNISKYAGKVVVIDGEFVHLVDNITDPAAKVEPIVSPDGTIVKSVGARSLSRHITVIDHIPFLHPITDTNGKVFEQNKKYFVRVGVGTDGATDSNPYVNIGDDFVELTEGESYAVGDPLVRYAPLSNTVDGENVIATDSAVYTKTRDTIPVVDTEYYTRSGDTFTLESGLSAFTEGMTYYVKSTMYKDYGPDYIPLFSPVAAQSALDNGMTLYTCSDEDDGYTWDNGEFVKDFNVYKASRFKPVTLTSIDETDRTLYFYKRSDHIWRKYEGSTDSSGIFIEVTEGLEYFILDFSKEAGLVNLGKRFSYTTRFNTNVTLDLSVDNLVSLAGDTEVESIFVENSNLCSQYVGRLYKYEKRLGVRADETALYENHISILPITGSRSINSSTDAANTPGKILGVKGTAWDRCFVVTDEMERSYIKKYHDELAENTRLQAKVKALEAIITTKLSPDSGS